MSEGLSKTPEKSSTEKKAEVLAYLRRKKAELESEFQFLEELKRRGNSSSSWKPQEIHGSIKRDRFDPTNLKDKTEAFVLGDEESTGSKFSIERRLEELRIQIIDLREKIEKEQE
jgi:hypothetical protein